MKNVFWGIAGWNTLGFLLGPWLGISRSQEQNLGIEFLVAIAVPAFLAMALWIKDPTAN